MIRAMISKHARGMIKVTITQIVAFQMGLMLIVTTASAARSPSTALNIEFLKGKADIAVIGTQTIKVMEKEGVGSVGDFIRNLR